MKPAQLKLWYCIAFCSLGMIIGFDAFRPGFMSPDTLEQYGQALTGAYSDWHPPAMAFVWHLLNYVHKGPSIMLAMQLTLFWTAIFLLLRTFHNWWWMLSISLFAYAPFVQNFTGYIVKDSQMALSWLLMFAITFPGIVRKRPLSGIATAASLLLLMYGTWVRPNALPGAIPLALLWIIAVLPATALRRKAIIAGAVIIAIPSTQWILNKAIIRPQHDYAQNKLYLHDLTGIMISTGDDVIPAAAFPQGRPDTAWLHRKYHPATFDMAWWNHDNVNARPPQTPQAFAALSAAWRHAILAYPGVYLTNRMDGYLYYLRIKKRSDEFYYYYPWINRNDYGITLKSGPAYAPITNSIKAQSAMPYMQPWFWLFVNILVFALIPFLRTKDAKNTAGALALSGLLYQLPVFFIFQVDTDFRYFYWNCIATCIALLIAASDRFAWHE